ncbi:MAG: hypothetical protein M3Y71_12605 [Actinomycetota bacterium]|nr:hypothetical protein [Actinomycetota bacterium]
MSAPYSRLSGSHPHQRVRGPASVACYSMNQPTGVGQCDVIDVIDVIDPSVNTVGDAIDPATTDGSCRPANAKTYFVWRVVG